jgi:hypothetical protein
VHKGHPVTLSCGAGLEGASGLTFSYWATIFADGTVWASAEIVDSFTATSGSRIYAANQNGALTNTKYASTGSAAIPSHFSGSPGLLRRGLLPTNHPLVGRYPV